MSNVSSILRPMLAIAMALSGIARAEAPLIPSWLNDPAAGSADVGSGTAHAARDVTLFGAVGDGIADDRAAIQGAVDAANADGGGAVFMPAGVYAVSGPIYMRSNVLMEGVGDNSVILAEQNTVGVIFVGTPEDRIVDTILRDLTVRGSGNPAYSGNTLISMNRHVERAWIDRVWMDQAGYDAWNALKETRQVYVTRCRITGAGDDGLNPGGGGVGDQLGSRDIVLSQNYISGVTNDGIHVSYKSGGIQVIGNTIVDSGVGIGVFFSDHSSIKENVIRGCGTGILNRAHGSQHLVISGNLIENTTSGPGIKFGFDHQRVEISGNTILMPAGGSAHGIEEIGGIHVTIRDNVIQGASDGIRVTSGDHTVVVGNLVTQAQNGVVFDGSDGVVSGNNVIQVVVRGIDLPGGAGQARNLVSGNLVRGVELDDGIRIASSETVITGNHVFDVGNLSIQDLGSGNTIANNYVDAEVVVGPTSRILHFASDGRTGFGTSTPREAVEVAGTVRAEALRVGRYRIFAGVDGVYVEDLDSGAVGRVILESQPEGPAPTQVQSPPGLGGIVEVERQAADDR